jgi:hypothetical protein
MSKTGSILVAMLLAASLPVASVASAAPTHPARILRTTYVNGKHIVTGKFAIGPWALGEKMAGDVRCHIYMTWERRGGGDAAWRTTYVKARMVAGQTRLRHFSLTLRDLHHLFKDDPARWDTGCNLLG